ncbi:MAG: esterase-like activity of phytase family protein [Alphaproteobacteria bacterium]|jgi:hypothetical protein
MVLALMVSAGAAAEPLLLDSARVRLNPEGHGQVAVGGLEYRGGLVLTSNDDRFGGLSGLEVSADGSRALALSDHGRWVEFGLVYDDDGRLIGVGPGTITSLHGIGGQPLADNGRDSEDLARLSDGRLAVSFERLHRVVLYSTAPAPGPAQRLNPPRKLAWAPGNGGIEGLTELRPGRLLALTEALLVGGDRVMGWLLSPAAGTDDELFFATTRDFKPTSLATLPGGDVMVLERRYSVLAGVAVRLSRIDADSIVPGALLTGTEIARISPPLTVDNFEGLALRQGDDGRLLVYLVSDDNFNPLQRTLLLMFRLAE